MKRIQLKEGSLALQATRLLQQFKQDHPDQQHSARERRQALHHHLAVLELDAGTRLKKLQSFIVLLASYEPDHDKI